MNTEIARILEMFKNNWEGNMWHGGNLKWVLADITAERAFQKPGAGSHNIYELIMHMVCWREWALQQLKGNVSYKVELNSEIDWPVNYKRDEADWENALATLEKSQNDLANALVDFDDNKLEELVPERKFSWYVMLHGLIQHDIYHSAQISMLKK